MNTSCKLKLFSGNQCPDDQFVKKLSLEEKTKPQFESVILCNNCINCP